MKIGGYIAFLVICMSAATVVSFLLIGLILGLFFALLAAFFSFIFAFHVSKEHEYAQAEYYIKEEETKKYWEVAKEHPDFIGLENTRKAGFN